MVKVKVLEVDIKRRRIALTLRLSDRSRDHTAPQTGAQPSTAKGKKPEARPQPETAMAAAFAKLRK